MANGSNLERVQGAHLDPGQVVEQRLALAEAEIDYPPPFGQRPAHERLRDRGEVVDRVDLPHHVVADPQIVDDRVQTGDAGAGAAHR